MKIRATIFATMMSAFSALTVAPPAAFAWTDPCQGSPTPGTICADGTVYAGQTPDGNVPMATTTTDVNSSSYSLSLSPWNNGNKTYVMTGLSNAITGQANTAALVASTDAESPYKSAQACSTLGAFGHNDWYLPSTNELSVMLSNATAIGNFLSGYTYWSSSELGINNSSGAYAMEQSIGNSAMGGLKSQSNRFRCIRKIVVLAAGKTYYVSPSGNDSNSGLSSTAAWKTVAKVNSSYFNGGDSVLFQGGQTFAGCLSFSGSNVTSSSTSTFIIGSYGTGKFTLNSTCTGTRAAAVSVDGVTGFTLQNAVLTPVAGTATQFGVWLQNTTVSAAVSGMTIQNSDISGFTTTLTSDTSAEIFITGYPGSGLSNVNILNNALHGASGLSSTDDFAVNGYGNGQNLTNVTYQGNTVYNIGGRPGVSDTGNGILANGVNGGMIQNNLVHDLAANANSCGGAAGLWAYNSNNITIQHNEVYNVRPSTYTTGCDWDAFDLDGHVTNSVVQYNYSHDNAGAGYLSYGTSDSSNKTFRYNISQNDNSLLSNGYFGCFGIDNNSGSVNIYNNTCYIRPGGTGLGFGGGYPSSGLIANNIFYAPAGPNGISLFIYTSGVSTAPTVTLKNNNYYGTGNFSIAHWGANSYTSLATFQSQTGQDAGSTTTDPQLSNPGNGVTCNGYSSTCPQAYVLSSTSPRIGTGLNLQSGYSISPGSNDYYGNAIPNTTGTGFNLGAYGGTQ